MGERPGTTGNGLFTLQWHITHRCNLRCTHCYQDDFTALESVDAMGRVVEQYVELLSRLGMRGFLNVTGGEPLVHPGLFTLLDRAKDAGLETAVLTNGTLIGKREARRLKACDVDYVQVSLDGIRKTHDSIRGSGSFDKAVQGIRHLRSEGIFTTVSFTAQRRNIGDFPKLARFCREADVNKLWFDRVVVPVEEDTDRLSVGARQYRALVRKAAKLARTTPATCIRALQFLECGPDAPVYRCTAGERLLAVLANGDVMPCRRLPMVLGNLRDESLASIYFQSEGAVALRESDVPAACSACPHAATCSGGAKCIAYARGEGFSAADPDCPLVFRG